MAVNDSPALGRLRVVLVETRNPLNIGAAARAMSNFGVRTLRLVQPYEKAFREARSAVGAADILAEAQVFESVAEAVADSSLVVGTTAARRRELHHPAYRVEEGAELVREHLVSGEAAVLFGSESYGFCHWTMSIATPGTNASLNLGQAVAVCLHELVREVGKRKQVPASDLLGASVGMTESGELPRPAEVGMTELADGRASSGEVDRVTETLFDVLRETRYWHPGSGATTEEKVRRLVRRLHLSCEDAEVLLGMCRQILWRIRKGDSKG